MQMENQKAEKQMQTSLSDTTVLDIVVTKVREQILQWLKRTGLYLTTLPNLLGVKNLDILFCKGCRHSWGS